MIVHRKNYLEIPALIELLQARALSFSVSHVLSDRHTGELIEESLKLKELNGRNTFRPLAGRSQESWF